MAVNLLLVEQGGRLNIGKAIALSDVEPQETLLCRESGASNRMKGLVEQ
jgi:hypothetical protein